MSSKGSDRCLPQERRCVHAVASLALSVRSGQESPAHSGRDLWCAASLGTSRWEAQESRERPLNSFLFLYECRWLTFRQYTWSQYTDCTRENSGAPDRADCATAAAPHPAFHAAFRLTSQWSRVTCDTLDGRHVLIGYVTCVTCDSTAGPCSSVTLRRGPSHAPNAIGKVSVWCSTRGPGRRWNRDRLR